MKARILIIITDIVISSMALFVFNTPDISAKCIHVEDCLDGFVFLSLKDQIHMTRILPNITCPNQDHVLTERPSGKLACVTNHMAEKTGWHIHYRNVVDIKAQYTVAKSGSFVHHVSLEITGATLDDMTHQNQTLTIHITPNKEYGVLSFQMPFDILDGHFSYCNPASGNHPNTPYVMIVDGVEHGLEKSVNSRGQTAVNIPINENSDVIDVIRTCHS